MELRSEIAEIHASDLGIVGELRHHRMRDLRRDDAIFGVRWNKGADPAMVRTHDAVGLVAETGVGGQAVRNDFDRASIFGEIGEVADELGNVFIRIPKFYIRKRDGANHRSWEVSKTRYNGFSLPACFADFDNDDRVVEELPYVDIAKYKGTTIGGRLCSLPDMFPTSSRSIVAFRNDARANNGVLQSRGYGILDIHGVDVLRTLFLIEFANLDAQAIMPGWTGGRQSTADAAVLDALLPQNFITVSTAAANHYRVGDPIAIGTTTWNTTVTQGPRTVTEIGQPDEMGRVPVHFDGDPVNISMGNVLQHAPWRNGFSRDILASSGQPGDNNNRQPMSYRGVESFYGDIWDWVDGVNTNDHQSWIAFNQDRYASNLFAPPYRPLNYVNAPNNGYTREMGFDNRIHWNTALNVAEFPTLTTGASASTFYADQYWQAAVARVARFGGSLSGVSFSGVSAWHLSNSSGYTSASIGARLLKKAL
ncbi:MAG: hypothetical protein FWF59_02265 [Turicibacter sp.]|nr:hypothetical protein [Turicibacter sp.]